MNNQCQLCGRRITGWKFMNFVPFTGVPACPISHGLNLLNCLECTLSFDAQFYGTSNKEIEDYLDWLKKMESIKCL